MNPEFEPWAQLRQQGAACLRPGFADRVLRAARQGVASAPSFISQFAFGAATAALCYGVVAMFTAHHAGSDNLAGWQEIASANVADAGLPQ